MIGFIIFFAVSFAFAISFMLRMKKKTKEIVTFVTLALLGFVIWISIFLDKTINPNQWISWVIDLTGL